MRLLHRLAFILPVLVAVSVLADEPVPAPAATPVHYEWKIEDLYTGPHQDDFNRLRYEIPNIVRQSEIDIAVTMGLNFQEGWNHPLVIRFVDGSPSGVENVLAFVELLTDGKDSMQRLNINLDAYARDRFNFEKVFRHELFHAMLNDALGDNALNVPHWVHEGMAVFAADQGEQMLDSYLSQIEQGTEEQLLHGLPDGMLGGVDYIEAYLAIQYIRNVHGINSLQAFTRALVADNGDVTAAVQSSCNEDLGTFKANAHDYALSELRRIRRTLRGRQDSNPY